MREVAAGKKLTIIGRAAHELSQAIAGCAADIAVKSWASEDLFEALRRSPLASRDATVLVCTDPDLTDQLCSHTDALSGIALRFSELIVPSLAPDLEPHLCWDPNFSFLERSDTSTWSWIDASSASADITVRQPSPLSSWTQALLGIVSAGELPRQVRLSCGPVDVTIAVSQGMTEVILPVHFSGPIATISIVSEAPIFASDDRVLSVAISDFELVSMDRRVLISKIEAYASLDTSRPTDIRAIRERLHCAGYFSVSGVRASSNGISTARSIGITNASPIQTSLGIPTAPILHRSNLKLQEEWQQLPGSVTWLHASN
ncbi:hypothetical protein J2Y55_005842 [Bosea sp. BE125]|uniref:hypothetical protein n=1 Tax=Bosea sp. BE125 TaxID=2817909 RepID=UPI00285C6453|nr:hypothetical protein [Bosea sp. BE125]MDR6874804.1 hypothetical protein [Bosea sp. BE125]